MDPVTEENIRRWSLNKIPALSKQPTWSIIYQFWKRWRYILTHQGWGYKTFFNTAINSDGKILSQILAEEEPDFDDPIWRKEGNES